MSMDIYFDPNLVPIITESFSGIINVLSEVASEYNDFSANISEGYNGEAKDDIAIFAGVMGRHLNSLIGLYSAAFSMVINVMEEADAFDKWLSIREQAYIDKFTSQIEALRGGEQGRKQNHISQDAINSRRNYVY